MKIIKRIFIGLVLLLVVVAVAVAFGTAPMGKKYVNEHGQELIGRRIQIEDFKLNILTGNVALSNANIYEKNGDSVFASVKKIDLDLSMIDLIQGKIHIEDLDIKKPVVKVVQRGHQFNFDDLVATLSEGESSQYTIDDFTLKGGEIHYLDLTEPSIPFSYTMDKLRVDIDNFNTSAPNHIQLSARLGKHGELEAVYDGMISDQSNMNLSVELEDVDLTGLSPLFVQMFGKSVVSGELDMTSEISCVNGHINGQNHIVIDEPKVEKVKNLSFTPEYKKLPLKTALYLLTDRHGKCELDIPVTGSKDDPRFSYKRSVMKGLGKCLVKIVTSPFHKDKVEEMASEED